VSSIHCRASFIISSSLSVTAFNRATESSPVPSTAANHCVMVVWLNDPLVVNISFADASIKETIWSAVSSTSTKSVARSSTTGPKSDTALGPGSSLGRWF
jgi:hypothetical protein